MPTPPLPAYTLNILLLLCILTIMNYWDTSHALVRKSKEFCTDLQAQLGAHGFNLDSSDHSET